MPGLLNKRHEQFANGLASGKSASQSYADAGYTNACRQSASRLAAKAYIKQRVIELKERPQSAVKVDGRDLETGRFISGNSGGGRPKGSRSLLGTKFVEDLHAEWQRSGPEALKRVAEHDPVAFVRVVANVLPKEIDATLTIESELFKEARDFHSAWVLARQFIGSDDDKMIELNPIEDSVDAAE